VSGFYNNLDVTEVSRDKWRLDSALRYQSNAIGDVVTVPAGFVTDFATVPRLPVVYLMFDGYGDRAAVVHDYLYRSGDHPRSTCDQVFYESLLADGVSNWRAGLMYAAVRVFGKKFFRRGLI
jgi:hypothetical protein